MVAADGARLTPIDTFESASQFRLNAFEPAHVKLAPDTFVACYGRGFLPLSGAHVGVGTLSLLSV